MNRTFVFIYARTDSSRLPGKIFLSIGGHRLIDIVHARAKRINVNQVVVLTTLRSADDDLAAYCAQKGYDCFRGSPTDLVLRTMQAINFYKPSVLVRINADSPLLEPALVNASLDYMLAGGHNQQLEPDMVSNIVNRTFPYGVAVECVSANAYLRCSVQATLEEREHVTQHLYRIGGSLSLHSMSDKVGDSSRWRLTLDTEQDYRKLTLLFQKHDILTAPYWEVLNTHKPDLLFVPFSNRQT